MKTLGFIFSIMVLAIATRGILAVEYTVTNLAPNTPGGAHFETDFGAPYALQTMNDATNFIWNLFQQSSPDDRKPTQAVALFIDATVADGILAYVSNDQIHYNAKYIRGNSTDLTREFNGVMYHEMTHVWQWNGNGQASGGLIDGIADFVRLKAGFAPTDWVQRGHGDRWDQGYEVTARFLEYCDGLMSGFVGQLNNRMRNGYSGDYFVELLGKTVDQLWADYKATYGTA